MGAKGFQYLIDKQELRDGLRALWLQVDENGDPKWAGIQIANALGFEAKEVSDNPYAEIPSKHIYYYRKKFGLPLRNEFRGYPHRYKYSRQEESIDLKEIIDRVEAIPLLDFNSRMMRAANLFLFWGGLRNTENRLLTPADCTITEDRMRIEAFRLKKGRNITRAEATYPIALVRSWWGVEELVNWIQFIERTKDADARIFDVSERTLQRWVKKLFPQGYPHQMRLSRITYFCSDSDFSIAEIKGWTGLHLITIDHYILRSGRYSTQATDKMDAKMRDELVDRPE